MKIVVWKLNRKGKKSKKVLRISELGIAKILKQVFSESKRVTKAF